MPTLEEIEAAVVSLPEREQKALFQFLSKRLNSKRKQRRGLKADARPPLEGLPSELSINTRKRLREIIADHHAANR